MLNCHCAINIAMKTAHFAWYESVDGIFTANLVSISSEECPVNEYNIAKVQSYQAVSISPSK